MVPVPAGTFRMGSPDGVGDTAEHPQHEVTLSAYCVDRTEVTVKAYAECVASKSCPVASTTVNWTRYSAAEAKLYSQFCNRDDHADHPINCVDWSQASAYCAWVGKRLPTEAEWEYAARGNDDRLYPWGNDAPSAKRINACGGECVAMAKRLLNQEWVRMYDGMDGWETTDPVGSFPAGASPFGALDMAGNVLEWTADWYGPYSMATPPNPHGAKTGSSRVARGGGWFDIVADGIRAAFRVAVGPSVRLSYLGFRCSRGPTGT
jgi:formylglycine-generating enzyme required for sulfatase activity